jgi:1-acyl-sn-glycerol-3-phosphate acyltransferase
MTLARKVISFVVKRITFIICRIDAAQLSKIPAQGPLILAMNHINFMDVPVFYTQLEPRLITGFAKAESWDDPLLGWLFRLYGGIPIRRGSADLTALRAGLKALKAGQILAVAPEGTRSGDGRLQRGNAGVVFVALRSGAPLLPVVYYGAENYLSNLKRLRRTDFHIVVGQPFYLQTEGIKVTSDVRRQLVDEIMWQMAALLPPYYRGEYANLSAATETYLRFPPNSESNLKQA